MLRLKLVYAAAICLCTLCFAVPSEAARQIENTSDNNIGSGYAQQQSITSIYSGESLQIYGFSVPGTDGGMIPQGDIDNPNWYYTVMHLSQLLYRCPQYYHPILINLQRVLPGIGTPLMLPTPGEEPIGPVKDGIADMDKFLERYGCGSANTIRMFNNLLSQFMGVDPVTSASLRMPPWGVSEEELRKIETERMSERRAAGVPLAYHDVRRVDDFVPSGVPRDHPLFSISDFLHDGEQRILKCNYGPVVEGSNEYRYFQFWYESVPSEAKEAIKSNSDHLLRLIGAVALRECPATLEEAAAVVQQSEATLARWADGE